MERLRGRRRRPARLVGHRASRGNQRSALRRWTLVGGAVSLLSRAGRGARTGRWAPAQLVPGTRPGWSTHYGLGSFRQTASLDATFAAMEDSGKSYRTSLPDVDQEVFAGTRLARTDLSHIPHLVRGGLSRRLRSRPPRPRCASCVSRGDGHSPPCRDGARSRCCRRRWAGWHTPAMPPCVNCR